MTTVCITRSLVAVSIAMLVAGCSGGGSSPPATPSTSSTPPTSTSTAPSQPSVTAPIIDNEDLSAGLKGIDANNNGIRDDIDRLIGLRYALTPKMKNAAEQEARALQKAMEATTKAQARLTGSEIMRAGACSFKQFPRSDAKDSKFRELMSKEIESLTANTRERYIAYWNGEKLAGGMVFRQPEEPVCD